jgi:alanyl-tRNA synthetase
LGFGQAPPSNIPSQPTPQRRSSLAGLGFGQGAPSIIQPQPNLQNSVKKLENEKSKKLLNNQKAEEKRLAKEKAQKQAKFNANVAAKKKAINNAKLKAEQNSKPVSWVPNSLATILKPGTPVDFIYQKDGKKHKGKVIGLGKTQGKGQPAVDIQSNIKDYVAHVATKKGANMISLNPRQRYYKNGVISKPTQYIA